MIRAFTTIATRTVTGRAQTRAERLLPRGWQRATAVSANTVRNARAAPDRHDRWSPARDELWALVEPTLTPTSRVLVVGAGNCDTVPLTRIAAHSASVTLLDLDRAAIRRARRRRPAALRPRIEVTAHDITAGAADAITAAALERSTPAAELSTAPLPGAPYDLVIGDLFYSQLLYPAMLDLEIPEPQRRALLARHAPPLTRAVVARMHASAPAGNVLHIHDPIAWWAGHPQPVTLTEILATAGDDIDAALSLTRLGTGPRSTDPRSALEHLRLPILATRLWRWPFTDAVDYLAVATLAAGTGLGENVRRYRSSP